MDKSKLKRILLALSTSEEKDKLLELDMQKGLEEKSRRQFGLVGKNFNELALIVEKHGVAIVKQDKRDKAISEVVDDNFNTLGKAIKGTAELAETKGDVFGPNKSTDSNLAAFDGVTGKKIKDSGITTKQIKDAFGKIVQLEKTGQPRFGWVGGSDGHHIQDEGTALTQRANLNFIGTGVAVTDNEATNASDITFTGGGSDDFADSEVPTGTIDGSNPTFTLANTPIAGSVHLYLNGLRQKAGAGNDYTISGLTITMLNIPQPGDTLLGDYRY